MSFLLRPLRWGASFWRSTRRTVATLPEAIESILVLPQLSRQLDAVQQNTQVLPGVLSELERVRYDTSRLHMIETNTGTIALEIPGLIVPLQDVDRTLHTLADIAAPLEGMASRVGRWDDRRARRRNGRR